MELGDVRELIEKIIQRSKTADFSQTNPTYEDTLMANVAVSLFLKGKLTEEEVSKNFITWCNKKTDEELAFLIWNALYLLRSGK